MSAGGIKFKKRRPSEEMALQITSMADIFTIILVFLLKSFATSAANITPSGGMSLPAANGDEAVVEALKLEVSEIGVQVEGKPVMALEKFRFRAGELQGNGTLKSLTATLQRERQRQLLIAKSNSQVKVDAKILIIADQRTPYSTLKSVLASAATQGYTDFKLAVVKGD